MGNGDQETSFAVKYRPEIDGLRAVAVVPVILYHAHIPGFSGGFVGVDVFFVISGYLITSILFAEIATGKFSIWRFYERRVRRIVPALTVVSLVSIILGYWLLVPSQFADLLNAVSATALFGSNIYFWATLDYFSPNADLNPMLHTWSLGVEEQFYILFPIALLILSKIRLSAILPALLVVITLSLALSSYLASAGVYSEANFFLLPTRAWELTAGSLLAAAPKAALGSRTRNVLSGLGLLMILASVFALDDTMPFPGYLAIPTVLGTMLVIRYADAANLAGQTLRLRPFVGIGLISYSAYLWHQPFLAYARHATFGEPSGEAIIAIILAVFVVSYLSWRFVEQPFRRQLLRRYPSRGVVAIGVMPLAVLATGVFYLSNDGAYTRRYPAEVRAAIAYLDYKETAEYAEQFKTGCFVSGTGSWGPYPFDDCVRFSDSERNVLILGDSHAAMLAVALAEVSDAHFIQANASGCHPIEGLAGEEICTRMRDMVLDTAFADDRLDTVILAARWRAAHVDGIASLVGKLHAAGLQVVVVGPAPEYDRDFPLVLAQSMMAGTPDSTQSGLLGERFELDASIREALAGLPATYVSLSDTICPDGLCHALTSTQAPMQFDYGHLTLSAARDVAPAIVSEAGL